MDEASQPRPPSKKERSPVVRVRRRPKRPRHAALAAAVEPAVRHAEPARAAPGRREPAAPTAPAAPSVPASGRRRRSPSAAPAAANAATRRRWRARHPRGDAHARAARARRTRATPRSTDAAGGGGDSTVGGEASRPPVPAGSRRASRRRPRRREEVRMGRRRLWPPSLPHVHDDGGVGEMVRKHVHEPEGSDALQFRGVPKWISYQHIRGAATAKSSGSTTPAGSASRARDVFRLPRTSGWASTIGCVARLLHGRRLVRLLEDLPLSRAGAQFGAIRAREQCG